MKLRVRHSPILLLLLPSLASALTLPPSGASVADGDKSGLLASSGKSSGDSSVPSSGRKDIPTKDAPVDGKDGKPHTGPFVETDGIVDDGSQVLPPLKGRPDDPSIVDGKKIPKTNDGVMFDKNRDRPQEGTTGTEGGVSEKDKARKLQESMTGEKLVTQPEAPKEQPPLPHSEQEKMDKVVKSQNPSKQVSQDKSESSEKGEKTDKTEKAYTGLGKPEDLPDRTYDGTAKDQSASVPNNLNKDHLMINDKPSTASKSSSSSTSGTEEDNEGIIQPFHSLVLSFTMILVSEIGDKTFLVAALMAMKHDRMVVFSAAFGALLVMTVLSAVLGHAVPTLLPRKLVSFLAAGLFFVFGAKLLKEGMQMDPKEGVSAEMYEVEQELAQKEKELGRERRGSIAADALEMGLDSRGSRAKGRFPTPPRSPSQSPSHSPSRDSRGLASLVQGVTNLFSLLLSPAWVQTFVMTFLGEWGDRSQIATIAMAAGQDYWWVTLGAISGHAICTGVAVIGGRAIAGRVSLKVVTVGGAVAFLLFGFIYFIEGFYA